MKMQTETPLVSVIIPVYNAERYLEQTVRSVQAQTITDMEILLVDDCSTDGSAVIMRRLAAEDQRIRLLMSSCNQGVATTRNIAIKNSRGTYLAFLDADDLWYPDKLRLQLALAVRENVEIVYCSYDIIDENSTPCRSAFIVSNETNLERTMWCSEISCSTALIRRDAMAGIEFSEVQYHEDLVMWITLLEDGCRAKGVREVLAAYRQSTGSRSSNKLESARNRWKVFKNVAHLPMYKRLYYFLRYAFAGAIKYWT